MVNLFDFKNILNDHFFEVHNQAFKFIGKCYLYELKLYEDCFKIMKKLETQAKRKKKDKNRVLVYNKIKLVISSIQKVSFRLKKYMIIYEKVLNRYSKIDKSEYQEQIDNIIKELKQYSEMKNGTEKVVS